jgi:hypothetical protein
MKWIIVSEKSLIRESIKIYLEGVADVSPKNITAKSFDDFMIDLNDPSKIDEKNNKFIIEFYYVSKTKNRIQNLKDSILNDPFDYYISDFLATIFFDQRFFEGDENWFLKKAVFFSFFGGKNCFSNDGNLFLNYCQLPQELDKLKDFITDEDFNKKNPLSTVRQENLWMKMKKTLISAFAHH